MIITRKRFEEEVAKRLQEQERQFQLQNHFGILDDKLYRMERELTDLRLRIHCLEEDDGTPTTGEVQK